MAVNHFVGGSNPSPGANEPHGVHCPALNVVRGSAPYYQPRRVYCPASEVMNLMRFMASGTGYNSFNINMHYVYVLLSQKDKKLYIGFNSDLKRRVKEHNDGKAPSTKSRCPLKLIYYEAHISKEDAKRRESYFKTAKGKSTLKQMLRGSLQEYIKSCLAIAAFLTLSLFLLFLPLMSYASQLIYTIQTGSFASIAAAQKQFDFIVQRLDEKELDYLRIEKVGKFYSVRLEKFENRVIAKKFLKTIKSRLSTAIILKAYIKNERVIRLYTGLSSVVENRVKEKSLSRPLLDEIKPRITEKADKKIKTEISAVAHEKKGDIYEKEGRDFLAIEEYRQAVKQGINHPDLFRKLAITLYNLGLVDDAIVEMEKAVKLSSNKDFLITMELGIFYLAKDRIEKAKEQFFAVLGMNPGFADAYYYLGKLFLREKDYDMAWLSVKMAQRLGHRGQDIVRKLGDLSKEPGVDPWNESGEDLYIRQILVDTYEKAEDIVNRISGGELFEDLAGSESMEPNASLGGFVGHFNPSELHPKIAEALLERGVLTDPVIVETERGFHIVQRIIPFDFNFWEKLLSIEVQPR